MPKLAFLRQPCSLHIQGKMRGLESPALVLTVGVIYRLWQRAGCQVLFLWLPLCSLTANPIVRKSISSICPWDKRWEVINLLYHLQDSQKLQNQKRSERRGKKRCRSRDWCLKSGHPPLFVRGVYVYGVWKAQKQNFLSVQFWCQAVCLRHFSGWD